MTSLALLPSFVASGIGWLPGVASTQGGAPTVRGTGKAFGYNHDLVPRCRTTTSSQTHASSSPDAFEDFIPRQGWDACNWSKGGDSVGGDTHLPDDGGTRFATGVLGTLGAAGTAGFLGGRMLSKSSSAGTSTGEKLTVVERARLMFNYCFQGLAKKAIDAKMRHTAKLLGYDTQDNNANSDHSGWFDWGRNAVWRGGTAVSGWVAGTAKYVYDTAQWAASTAYNAVSTRLRWAGEAWAGTQHSDGSNVTIRSEGGASEAVTIPDVSDLRDAVKEEDSENETFHDSLSCPDPRDSADYEVSLYSDEADGGGRQDLESAELQLRFASETDSSHDDGDVFEDCSEVSARDSEAAEDQKVVSVSEKLQQCFGGPQVARVDVDPSI